MKTLHKVLIPNLLVACLLTLSGPAFSHDKNGHDKQGRRGEKMMTKMDTDGDAQISFDEFTPRHKGIFVNADSNNDGLVTIDEIKTHHAERKANRASEHEAKMVEHFTAMDANGDGGVTQAEAKASIFARIDTDEDGYLSKDELKAAKHKMKGRHKGKHSKRHGRNHQAHDTSEDT